MLFAIVLHKDPGSDYGVTVPDLPGCFSAGRTLDEAIANSREAVELHIEGMLDLGMQLPAPGDLDKLQADENYAGGFWHLVQVDPANLGGAAQRVNITVPQRLLRKIDATAAALGEGRSNFLVTAAMKRIAEASRDSGTGALAQSGPVKRKLSAGRRSPRSTAVAKKK